MADDLVGPLDTGDGTTDAIALGVAAATEELIAATNKIGQAIQSILDRLEAVETVEQTTATVDPGEWVAWVRTSYRLDAHIPDDWASIAGVRQELHALHAAWVAAYKADGTPRVSHLAIAWHDSLARALARFPTWLARDEKHTGVEPPPWVDPPPWTKIPSTAS